MPRFARNTDPQTSHEAASSTTEEKLSRLESFVLAQFNLGVHYTDEELVQAFERIGYPASPQGIRTARVRLDRKGLLEVVGESKTIFNRTARVWALKQVA